MMRPWIQAKRLSWLSITPLSPLLSHQLVRATSPGAGVPHVVFGDPGLVGEHRQLAEPESLRAIPVAPPPYWELQDLL